MYEWIKLGIGAVTGAVWGAVGYAVAKKGGEPFAPSKFGKTMLIGLVIGLFANGLGVNVVEAEGYTLLQLATILADKLEKLLEK